VTQATKNIRKSNPQNAKFSYARGMVLVGIIFPFHITAGKKLET